MPRWLWGNDRVAFEAVASNGNSGGLLSFWKEDFFCVETKRVSQRYILLVRKIRENRVRCGIGNIYAPNDDAERATF